MSSELMFTSESVTAGHPDKLCDQISDAIVDRFLTEDPYARIRAECAVFNAIVFIACRFATKAKVDIAHVARKTIKRIGYDQPDFNAKACSILSTPKALPINPADVFNEQTLDNAAIEKIPAKNQVTVFGFACKHTPNLLPLPIWLANRLAARLARVQHEKILPYLLPDGRVQVGVVFKNHRPEKIHSITIMASQADGREQKNSKIKTDLHDTVLQPVFDSEQIKIDKHSQLVVNPDGPYMGGPSHHSGLTGRKNAIDTYGEYTRHSGKALSGKDPLRVDRAGAYAARHAAKNVVAAGLADECEVMLSYAIGFSRPVSLFVRIFGGHLVSDEEITRRVARHFDFRPAAILKHFQLRRLPSLDPMGFYQKIAAYGHFGRTEMDLPWEKTDFTEALQESS